MAACSSATVRAADDHLRGGRRLIGYYEPHIIHGMRWPVTCSSMSRGKCNAFMENNGLLRGNPFWSAIRTFGTKLHGMPSAVSQGSREAAAG